MPSIRQDKHGSYFIDYRHNGKRTRKSFGPGATGKSLAEIALAETTLKIKNEKMGVIENIDAQVFFDKYLTYAEANKKRSSYLRDVITFQHFLPTIKDKDMSDIKAKDIERYKLKRMDVVGQSTINRELNTIIAAFNKAVEWGYLVKNPLTSVKKFKESKKAPRFFTHDELNLVFNNITDSRIYSIVFLLLHTGIRREELIYLTWADIDLKNSLIYIQPKPGWSPKDYEMRAIPINKQVKELLVSLPRDGKRVFDNGNGNFIYVMPTSLSKAFKKVLRRVGIDEPEATLHTLRHTFASHLIMSGVDLATVQRLLGHSDIKTTMRYAHLAPGHLKKATDKLGETLCPFSAHMPTKKKDNIVPLKTKLASNPA